MATPNLDPASLGIPLEQLRFEAEDGRYSVELGYHRDGIYFVCERGWADDECGLELVAIFSRLLDAVERFDPDACIYLCPDYSDYRGSSNATRKAMLRDVVMRPSLGAVAFWGAGFITRSVAMLLNVALPRLAARPFRTQEQALAFLEDQLPDPLAQEPSLAPEPTDERLQEGTLDAAVLASFLLRHSECVGIRQLGGKRRRVVVPEDWIWRAPSGATLRFSLVDDDVLLGESIGPVSPSEMRVRRELMDRALDDLGVKRVTLLLDITGQPPLDSVVAQGRAAYFRERSDRLLNIVLVGDPARMGDIEPILLVGSSPLRVRPVFTDVDRALVALDLARAERLAAARELALPTEPAALEQLTRDLHHSLRDHRVALDRLFSFVGRVSWDETYLDDGLGVPDDVTEANPYWSVYGALHMMQQDMLDVLRERDARNRDLAVACEQAEAASRAKSQFLGTVSHELRTPLNAIFGMTALLRDSGVEGDQLRHVQGLERASGQLTRLVGDLLDITRIEEGALELRPAPFTVPDLIDELCERWAPVARSKGLTLQTAIAPGLERPLVGDRGRALQVIGHLVDNAVKFTERGWVRVSVTPAAPGRVAFEVQDTGRGIPADEVSTVFERFERGVGNRADVVPGVGLGLSICSQLTELMGGEIAVQSELGQGTSFRIELPLPLADGGALPAPVAAVTTPASTPADFSDLLVLLAEDDPASRYVASRLLESLGCEVVVAEDGRAALERLQEGRYDLVFMDCQMPFMDGLEVTRRFRESEPEGEHTPIVALTAYAFDEDRERMLAAGMDEHQAKPINRARFQELLLRWGS